MPLSRVGVALIMNIYEMFFNLSLVLVSVSFVFCVGLLIDRYPKIHRFGHIYEKTEVETIKDDKTVKIKKRLNARVVFLSWPLLIILILLVSLALYFHSMILSRSSLEFGDYVANFLFPIVYFLLPGLAERIITGSVLLAVRDDFKHYKCHSEKRQILLRRFSTETIDAIDKSHHYSVYILIDSIPKFIALLMSPICYYMCRNTWWVTVVAVILYLVFGFLTEWKLRR